MKIRIALVMLIAGLALQTAIAASLTAVRLRCEYRENPLGIEAAKPRLSWWIKSEERGQRQIAYQILAASSRELLDQGRGDLWDSGKVASEQSVLVPYGGKALGAHRQAWWKVRVWPAKGGNEPSAWSEPATWTMGLARPEDWQAKWILFEPKDQNAIPVTSQPLPLLRKGFTVGKPVRRAVVSVCGLGQYELSLNGKKVGDHAVDPGWTNYKKRCLYATYDVTTQVHQGENAVGVMLGNGMYNVTGGRYVKFKGSFGPPKMILQLRIELADGSEQTIVSDESWKGADGPVRFSCIYGGEDYDARQEQAGWNKPGFDDTKWAAATVTEGPGGRLAEQAQPPVKVMRELKAVKVSEPKPGVFVYDLGLNFSGWPQLTVQGAAGARVKMTPGELLGPDGLVTQRSSGGPTYYSYTLKGQGKETWAPRFSYYGFRYVQVEAQPPQGAAEPPKVAGVAGQFIHSSAAVAGRFECANPVVNQIHDLIDTAILSNLQSVLTDCPHREKLGWLEVSQLLGQAIMFNYDVPNLYGKICRDMTESQLEDGLVPDIAPEYTVFKDGFRDSPEWGSAAVINPWLVYQMYGDDSLIANQYDVMARYVEYLGSKAKDHILSHGLGDWYDIGPKGPGISQLTSLGVTATAVWYQDVKIMEQAAQLLDKAEDEKKYRELGGQIREAFNREFFHPESDSYDRGSQTAQAMPLVLGLVPEARRAAVAAGLAKAIRDGGNRVTAGDVGFHYLVAALTETGHDDVLYDMVTQDAGPGYVYQLKAGATSLTEAWDTKRTSSQNHCMLGHAEEWLYRGLGGISPAAPGFARVRIKPAVVGDLKGAAAEYDSVRGKIRCAWKREEGRFTVEVEVPVGAEAEVYVPAKSAEAVREGGKPAAQAGGVKGVRMDGRAAVIEVGSGRYQLETDAS